MVIQEAKEKLKIIKDVLFYYKQEMNKGHLEKQVVNKYLSIWENELTNIIQPNIYFYNIRYTPIWNDSFKEHYTFLHKTNGLKDSLYEVLFNINNIHALIKQGKLQSYSYNFQQLSHHCFFVEPEDQSKSSHPNRNGIVIPYPINNKNLFLIDGSHRALKARKDIQFDFMIEYIFDPFQLTPFCFDSYYDFIAYQLMISSHYLSYTNSLQERFGFLQYLETFLVESRNSIPLGTSNPYNANK